VLNGDPRVHGIVDSFRYPHRSSFASYHYPTQLPKRVRVLLAGLAVRCVRHLGLDNAGFNVEFFWDQQHDRITILEVNPRISQSHCALFEMVDGASSHQIALAVALGEEPDFPAGEGRFRSAARYFLRHTGDAMVARIPTPDELVALERDMPGVKVEIAVPAGRRLSDRTYHDSYSYKLAEICVGGEAHADIERKYRACVARLPFELIGQRAPREREPQS
jgi:biotin carboxylase